MATARRGGVGWRAVLAAVLQLLVAAEAGKYNAVFNFGDSLVDAGNLVTEGIPDYLATARPPYGQSYFGYPTGRCSDGRLVIDFIAQEFGLPLLPPSKAKNAPLFAGKDLSEAYNLIPHVVQGISDGVEQLIAEGAKDLIVPGVMPSGCFPVYLSMYVDPKEGYGPRTGCLKRFNTFSWVHNAMLKRALEKLRAKHPGVRIIYGDYFTPVIQFLLQPEKFGFHKQPPRACCGAPGKGPYNFNLTAKCGEPGATPCPDPKTHWSWDGIHLTEAAYEHIAKGWLHGEFADQPIIQSS
ncbi:unnamed protein product [Triticum turgidum subsp. durum]|uniref:GDSL esterase/lipase n=1 Tax=Triticum turgidum subsp. durum TaxID=4567 RepID=A0A9R0ZIH6_TRITD|nr:unnamed protein product [Triticum turgidum subsp. durum]